MAKKRTKAQDKAHEALLIKRGWWVLWLSLAVTIALEFIYPLHGHFALEEVPVFFAVFGFGACVAIIVVSVALGKWLKRKPTYYDEEGR